MKTVQEWLNEIDEECLVDTYFVDFPIDYMMIANKKLTLEEINERSKKHFLDFVHNLKKLEIKRSDTTWIFFACNQYHEGYSNIDVEMCRLDDINTSEQPQSYSWLFVDFAEVMGYYIADTNLTFKNIYTVLSKILYEVSFFGYDQKLMELERNKLEESIKEVERGECQSIEEFDKELREELGLDPSDPPDPEVEEKQRAIYSAEYEYNTFCRNREIEYLRTILLT